MASGRGPRIGGGTVDITADMTNYDNAMNALPSRAKAKIAETMRALKAEMARTSLELKAVSPSNTAEINRLTAAQAQLAAKMAAVHAVATRQATALQDVAKASRAAEQAHKAYSDAKNKEANPTLRQAVSDLSPDAQKNVKAQLANLQKKLGANKAKIDVVLSSPNASSRMGEIDGLTKKQAQLRAQMDEVSRAAIAQSLGLRIAAAEARRDADAVDRLRLAQAKVLGSGSSVGTGKMNKGMGIMMLSQAVDDAQYGFSAIVNNIPGILMAFGMTGGLAGGISIAGVAVNVLMKNWDSLKSALSISPVLSQAQEMEALAKATEHTAEETAKLMKYEEQRSTIKNQQGTKSEAQEGQKNMVKETIKDVGYNETRKEVKRFVGDRFEKALPAIGVDREGNASTLKTEYERLKKNYDRSAAGQEVVEGHGWNRTTDFTTTTETHRKKAEEAKRKLDAYLDEQVDKYMADLENDPAKLKAFSDNLVKERRNPKLAAGLVLSRPENLGGTEERTEANRQRAHAEEEIKRNAKAGQFADAMRDRLSRSMLARPDDPMARKAEEDDVRKKLKDAGKTEEEINDMIPRIMKNIKKELKELRDKKIFEGATPDAANAEMLAELKKKAEDEATTKAKAEMLARDKASGKIQLGMNEQRQSQTFSSGSELAKSLIQTSLNGNREMELQEKIAKGIDDLNVGMKGVNDKLGNPPKGQAIVAFKN